MIYFINVFNVHWFNILYILVEEQIEDMGFVEFERLAFERACTKLEPRLEKYLLKHDDMCLGSYKSIFVSMHLLFVKVV